MDITAVMEMYDNGVSLTDIAKQFDVSRQCVHQAVNKYKQFKVKETACVYSGLRNWMNANHIRISQLCKMDEFNGKKAYTLRLYFKGSSEMPKSVIDTILRITGLTYEEAFG